MPGPNPAGAATGELLYEVSGAVGVVTFNRPNQRNALTFAMYDELARICRSLTVGGDVKALVLTGAGAKAFASGTDISLFRQFRSGADGTQYEEHMESVMAAVEECAVPTIAALGGACTGGGAVIAACCDIRIAAPDLKFGFPIARTLGNCLSAQNLSRLVALFGFARTKELIFLSRLMDAREALGIGLIAEIVDVESSSDRRGGSGHDETSGHDSRGGQDKLSARALELATQMSELAPLTLYATKHMATRLRQGEGLSRRLASNDEGQGRRQAPERNSVQDRDLIELCYGSDDFRSGVEAFLAKRKPTWRGR